MGLSVRWVVRPSQVMVVLLRGELWVCGVGCWAVVVVVMLVVVVVVVVLVVLGLMGGGGGVGRGGGAGWVGGDCGAVSTPPGSPRTLVGLGFGLHLQPLGLLGLVHSGGTFGAGLGRDHSRGVPLPRVGLSRVVGWALEDEDVVQGEDRVLLCGCLCGGGSCWGQGGSGCSGCGALMAGAFLLLVLSPLFVTAGAASGGVGGAGGAGGAIVGGAFVGVGVPVGAWDRALTWGPVRGGGGPRLGDVGGVLPGRGCLACCWDAGVARVAAGGPPAGRFLAAALALAVALWIRSAGRGEKGVEEVEEDEDEEEVVVLGNAGCAAMQVGAALRAAAVSAAAIAGRMEGISSGCGLGAGGWRGAAAT